MGLNDLYVTVRSNTLLLEPLPTVNKVYSLVLCHERQAEVSSRKCTAQPEVTVFAMKTTSWETKFRDNRPRCGKCNKTNHTTKNCRAYLKCTFCGWNDHSFDFCRKWKVAAEAEQGRPLKGNQVTTHDKRDAMPIFPFSQQNCKQIIQLLNKSKYSFANQVGNSSNHEELLGPTIEEDDWDGN
ncbi:hypothetical protein TB2_041815 [Malus domestica]